MSFVTSSSSMPAASMADALELLRECHALLMQLRLQLALDGLREMTAPRED